MFQFSARTRSASSAFYDSVLAPLGAGRVMDFGEVIGYGVEASRISGSAHWLPASRTARTIWLSGPRTGRRGRVLRCGVGLGAVVLNAPREWPEYHEHYYGRFRTRSRRNNVEAVCHEAE